jgi:hypothetical protein
VPVRDEVRKRRIEDGGVFVNLPIHPTDFKLWPGNDSNQDPRSAHSTPGREVTDFQTDDYDSSGASLAQPKVGVNSIAFVVSHTIDGLRWGSFVTGIRDMYELAVEIGLRRLGPCKDGHIGGKEPEMPVYLAEGPDALLKKTLANRRKFQALDQTAYFLVPTSGNIAARWLALSFARNSGLDCCWGMVCLRHPGACQNCVVESMEHFKIRGDSLNPYESRAIIL